MYVGELRGVRRDRAEGVTGGLGGTCEAVELCDETCERVEARERTLEAEEVDRAMMRSRCGVST